MSKISDIFNKLVEEVEAILPSYSHLPDGLEPERNPSIKLRKGFSVTCDNATSGPVQYGCKFQLFERNYTIAITNIYTKTTDASGRDKYELAIMEDLFLIIKGILSKASLGGLVSGVDYVNDIGPQYLDSEKQEFLYTDVTFNIKYQESLT